MTDKKQPTPTQAPKPSEGTSINTQRPPTRESVVKGGAITVTNSAPPPKPKK